MKKFFPLLFVGLLYSFNTHAQSSSVQYVKPFGAVSMDELTMKECDFEKNANAEVLFDKGDIVVSSTKTMERHVRIKIFNDFGKSHANVHLVYHTEFLSGKGFSNIKAETVNLEDGKIVKTPLDESQIFTTKMSKNVSEIVFTLPNVKAGSVIEYKYDTYPGTVWVFQNDIPVQFSEVLFHYRNLMFSVAGESFLRQPLFIDSIDKKNMTQILALKDVHSLPNEPFMTAKKSNLQRMQFGTLSMAFLTWGEVAKELAAVKDYNLMPEITLTGQDDIINKANRLSSDDEKIAFLFDTIKHAMKWNGQTVPISLNGLKNAWEKKAGSSAEINLILLHFIRVIGYTAYPALVATRDYGDVSTSEADLYSVNSTVVTIPVDSTRRYVLDASNKYNFYDQVPPNIVNTYAIQIDLDQKLWKAIALENDVPARKLTTIDATIQPDGKIKGTASISSDSYYKSEILRLYNKLDRKTYLDSAFNQRNNIKINSFKIDSIKENKEALTQDISFTADFSTGDDSYLYCNTNLFSVTDDNPFKSEQRFSDIDLGYLADYGMNGIYRIPAGYRVDVLPKNITIIMPDRSIIFRRTVVQDNGTILVRYSITHEKTKYGLAEYQNLRGFYKQMYDLLNEQIVLKKAS